MNNNRQLGWRFARCPSCLELKITYTTLKYVDCGTYKCNRKLDLDADRVSRFEYEKVRGVCAFIKELDAVF
jgi:hypothetical protein